MRALLRFIDLRVLMLEFKGQEATTLTQKYQFYGFAVRQRVILKRQSQFPKFFKYVYPELFSSFHSKDINVSVHDAFLGGLKNTKKLLLGEILLL